MDAIYGDMSSLPVDSHHMVLGHSASGAQQLRYLVGVVCKIPIIAVVPVVLPP